MEDRSKWRWQCENRGPFAEQPDRQFQNSSGLIFLFLDGGADGRTCALGLQSTVDAGLLHARPPRPLLLWFHGAAFPPGSLLFIAQSALVHVRKVRVHRTLGWVGAALAAIMVASGFVVSTVMLRFEMTVLHRKNVAPFLSVLWCDMILFGTCMSLAIYFRKRPEYHRLFPGHLPAHASDFRQI